MKSVTFGFLKRLNSVFYKTITIMKKGILVIALILGTITVFAAPKNSQELKGSGRVITQTKDAKTFNSIEVSNSINVVMGNSIDGRIVIKADDNVMPYVKTRFEGLNLVIKIDLRINL